MWLEKKVNFLFLCIRHNHNFWAEKSGKIVSFTQIIIKTIHFCHSKLSKCKTQTVHMSFIAVKKLNVRITVHLCLSKLLETKRKNVSFYHSKLSKKDYFTFWWMFGGWRLNKYDCRMNMFEEYKKIIMWVKWYIDSVSEIQS